MTKAMHPARKAGLSEAHLEQQVLHLAQLYGWRAHHVRDSRHVLMGDVGFPDWVFARAGVVLIVELKREGGKPERAQDEWLSELGWPPGSQWLQSGRLRVYLVRPSDLDAFLEVLQDAVPGT